MCGSQHRTMAAKATLLIANFVPVQLDLSTNKILMRTLGADLSFIVGKCNKKAYFEALVLLKIIHLDG